MALTASYAHGFTCFGTDLSQKLHGFVQLSPLIDVQMVTKLYQEYKREQIRLSLRSPVHPPCRRIPVGFSR